jgi:hypothetical protein
MSVALLDIDYSKLYSLAGQRSETSKLTQNMYFLDQFTVFGNPFVVRIFVAI